MHGTEPESKSKTGLVPGLSVSAAIYIWLPLFLNLSPLLNQRMIKECHRNVLVDFLHPEWTLQII